MENIFVEFLPPWVETGLQPAFYDKESGSVLQQTARMYARVNMLIRMFNKLSKETKEIVENYIEQFNQLHDYVHDYFDNLDVQEEINNKLDAMVEAGTLQEIITTYIQSNVAWTFDSIAEMQSATNLIDGSYARTLGYYALNDGGGALYKIRTKVIGDTDDGGSIITLTDNTLVAELIVENNQVSVKQFGAYGDDTHADDTAFDNAIAYVGSHPGTLFINKGIYKLTTPLSVDWNSENFNQTFSKSFEICGVGTMDSKLHFTTIEGLYINPENNPLVINIHDFCIENSDYNPLEDTGNTRTPDVTHGYGLRVRHIGYMGRVKAIAIRGFYIGLMSSHCYGGPLFENIFTKNTVFGYYSTNDTTIQHNSCSYIGCECGYRQDNARATLTNVICESNQHLFKTNEYNQRAKFEGRGFYISGTASVVCNLCYTEDLYGNAIYVEDSQLIDNMSDFRNMMASHLQTADYADLSQWLEDNPGHNYDEIYVQLTSLSYNCVHFNGTYIGTSGKANVNVIGSGNTPLEKTECVKFVNMAQVGTYGNNFTRFYAGSTKPMLSFYNSPQSNGQVMDFAPNELFGTATLVNDRNKANVSGENTAVLKRKGNFTNVAYDEVGLIIKHNLDGSIRFYRQTVLNDTQVDLTEVMRIKNDNTVTFPQNT